MTPLAALLARRIAQTGPITLGDCMAECLLHPDHGYYSTRDPFGASGDFTTAPEVSQMFGELLGLCLAQAWLDQGSPSPFTLAELGPGRGTLMADVLRATVRIPGFHAGARLHLVEASARLRQVQAATLARSMLSSVTPAPAAAPVWLDTADDLPEAPLFLLANEFFDALPVFQFQRLHDGWRQRVVGLSQGQLAIGLSDPVPPPLPGPRFANDPPGTVVEVCPKALGIAATLGARIGFHGGAALIIDYGGWRSRGDTVQALRHHRPEPILAHPGEADLTAHVDFEALADGFCAAGTASRTSPGCDRTGLTAQGTLLHRLGIGPRAERLAAGLAGAALQSHLGAYRRLTHADEMGSLFKALAFHPPGTPPPPGFDPRP